MTTKGADFLDEAPLEIQGAAAWSPSRASTAARPGEWCGISVVDPWHGDGALVAKVVVDPATTMAHDGLSGLGIELVGRFVFFIF